MMNDISSFAIRILLPAWLFLLSATFGSALPESPGNQSLNLPRKEPEAQELTSENAFPELSFDKPVDIASPPDEQDRLFVVEQTGRVIVISDLSNPTRSVFLDLSTNVAAEQRGGEAGLLGIAFHPDYQENGYFYVFYNLITSTQLGTGLHDRLARFKADPENPTKALPESETPLITQYDQHPVHNAGDLEFGPDGYLYVALGDEGGIFDQFGNSQRIDGDFFSGILRIDVDQRPDSLPPNPHPASHGNYAIPPDNPFVGTTLFNGKPIDPRKIRTEFYAVGLRNPWRMAFDPQTGTLYSNDVGQKSREEMNVIIKGGNYGWVAHEGTLIHEDRLEPFYDESFNIWPIGEYDHSQGNSVAGALIYRGDKYPNLDGHYLFSEFWGGKIGAIDFPDSNHAQEVFTLVEEIKALREKLHSATPESIERQREWEETRSDDWKILSPTSTDSAEGTELRILDDSSILADGDNPWTETYTVEAEIDLDFSPIRAIKLDAMLDPSLPENGPGRWPTGEPTGNFVISEFMVSAGLASPTSELEAIPLHNASADFEPPGWGAAQSIDDVPDTGWTINPQMGEPHFAIYPLQEPIELNERTRFSFQIRQAHGQSANLGRFQLSATDRTKAISLPAFVREVLNTPKEQRSARDKAILTSYYRTVIDPNRQEIREAIRSKQEELAALLKANQRPIQWLTPERGISTIGQNPQTGDILLADWLDGEIRKLIPSETEPDRTLPPTLAETGAFSDLKSLTPSSAIVPYDVNSPFWSDHAVKSRWFSLPSAESTIRFQTEGPWEFPTGSIWVKHFDLEMIRGAPSSSRRIETRFLVRTEDGVYGATYRWNDAQTGATLVPEEGMNETFTVIENGRHREQVWHYPSRNECQQCHTEVGGYALGWNTHQMNRQIIDDNDNVNQLSALAEAGYLEGLPDNPSGLPRLAAVNDQNASVLKRVRSYLSANCVHCHQPGGPGRGAWDARFHQPLEESQIINAAPIDNLGDADNKIVKPGSPENSVLYRRIAEMGPYHMPPIATRVVNTAAVELMQDWIRRETPAYLNEENVGPTIRITRPSNHFATPPGTTMTLTAGAADSDGTIERVEFFSNSKLIGSAKARPFEIGWNVAELGDHNLTAVATDNDGTKTASRTITVHVSKNPSLIRSISVTTGNKISIQAPAINDSLGVLETSHDLNTWEPALTNTFNGSDWLLDAYSPQKSQHQFFRIRLKETLP